MALSDDARERLRTTLERVDLQTRTETEMMGTLPPRSVPLKSIYVCLFLFAGLHNFKIQWLSPSCDIVISRHILGMIPHDTIYIYLILMYIQGPICGS